MGLKFKRKYNLYFKFIEIVRKQIEVKNILHIFNLNII